MRMQFCSYKKVFNNMSKRHQFYISVSISDGTQSVLKPEGEEFDKIYYALLRSFPNAYAMR